MPNRLEEIGARANSIQPVDATAKRAVEYSRMYLKKAQAAQGQRQQFVADRLADAADALLRVAEHQQHLRTGGGPKGPPPAPNIQSHLQRAYFRTQQAGYFFEQSKDRQAAALPDWAHAFYQLAVRAYDRQDLLAAEENAKSAEDIVKALESLAQAAAPVPPPPPPRPRAARPRPDPL